MSEHYWLATCSRRLSELAGSHSAIQTDQIAVRLWRCAERSSYRQMHPVAAAEKAWQEMQQDMQQDMQRGTGICSTAATADATECAGSALESKP